MKLLYLGDVVGKSGRQAVLQHVPVLRKEFQLDGVIVNVENSANGFGVTSNIYHEFKDGGIDIMTGGDHSFDQKDAMMQIDNLPNLLRPHNLPTHIPGIGHKVFSVGGKQLLVVLMQAQLFMKHHVASPFEAMKDILKKYQLRKNVDAILLDFHGEATSERGAMGAMVDGQISAQVGSHTHIPTADHRILPGGTAFITDAGMCGDYDSVIGFDKELSLASFINVVRTHKLKVANGEGSVAGVVISIDDNTGLATDIQPIRRGGTLQQI